MKNPIKITEDWHLCNDDIYHRLFHFNCPSSPETPARCFQRVDAFSRVKYTYCDECGKSPSKAVAQKAKLLGEWSLVKK